MAGDFISYARADRGRIEALAAALEAQSPSVWRDRRIESGSQFSKMIEVEEAIAILDNAMKTNPALVVRVPSGPAAEPLRADPRWKGFDARVRGERDTGNAQTEGGRRG